VQSLDITAISHQPGAPVKRSERAFLPFFWQRGVTMRPLDLAGRGELRDLIDRQPGEEFAAAVDRFVSEVSDASARFSDQERVKAALEAVFAPLRAARRVRPEDASRLVRFLPDGGAPSGLLRSLAAAVTLSDGPEFLPAARHGSTLIGALRAGALVAAAKHQERAIVAVDDFGGEFDPHLALHLARELRTLSGQAIVTTRTPSVVDAFRISEIVRFYRSPGGRSAARGPQGNKRAERVAAQFYAGRLTRVLGASAVVVVDGVHDRLALEALERRATAAGKLPSLAGAGIVYVDVGGSGQLHKVAQAAKQLGLYVIALLDNDQPANARPNADVQRAVAEADVGLWLPPRCKLEWALTEGISDGDLKRAVSALTEAMPDLRIPAGLAAMAAETLRQAVRTLLHDSKGTVHAAYVEALHERRLAPTAITLLARLRQMAIERAEAGLVRW
jgi:putative ATP-dependent endonuclease of the OLD family